MFNSVALAGTGRKITTAQLLAVQLSKLVALLVCASLSSHGMLCHENLETGPTPVGSTG
jgi:hypothetical protein